MEGDGVVTINTVDEENKPNISMTLKVKDGKIEDMSVIGPGGIGNLHVHEIRFKLGSKEEPDPDNDECRCCHVENGVLVCVTCLC